MSLESIINRKPSSAWERFCDSPLIFLAKLAYHLNGVRSPSNSPRSSGLHRVRIVCISDTHNQHVHLPVLPEGDVLIHSGDLTQSGTAEEVQSALEWLSRQPHRHKIFIAGNHDTCLDNPDFIRSLPAKYPSLTYLQESSIVLHVRGRDISFYGSPFTPRHGSWRFQYPRPPPGRRRPHEDSQWFHIPDGTDVLITHGPPKCHLDMNNGCIDLLDALWRVKPKLHVFGHIHAARGTETLTWSNVQSSYEDILSGCGGWKKLSSLLCSWLWMVVVETRRTPSCTIPVTLLVNASSIGGFRDETLHGAIVVDI